jgi:hypothetical protein
MSSTAQYAEKRLDLLKDEMGKIKSIQRGGDSVCIEFENGMQLEISDREVNYQAISYLESEVQAAIHG